MDLHIATLEAQLDEMEKRANPMARAIGARMHIRRNNLRGLKQLNLPKRYAKSQVRSTGEHAIERDD